ncbi:hypothetical protein SETIT_8G117300v2 [Setaria italica]|uniref:Uncharacterized protein n=1 Tax=Setaria italica TaxID=4555 RepID=A0A368S6U1_SETIT|nr:hypothetical protein SETIT_8G117300v2 [Setaria italica]
MATHKRKTINLEQGWEFICCFADLIEAMFRCCRMLYNMCTQKPPHDYLQQLYEKYRESFEYITSMLAWLLSWGKDIHGNVCLLRIKRWMDRHHTYA